MSAYDGLLGQIWYDTLRLEIGSGLNFKNGLTASFNSATGLIDISADSAGGSASKVVDSGTTTGEDVESVFVPAVGEEASDFVVSAWAQVLTAPSSGTVRVVITTPHGSIRACPPQDLVSGVLWIPSFGVYSQTREITTSFEFSDVVGEMSMAWRVVII